jgi:hypothetical protein
MTLIEWVNKQRPIPNQSCPKCARVVYLDQEGYRRCGRWPYGSTNSCGWRCRKPYESKEARS